MADYGRKPTLLELRLLTAVVGCGAVVCFGFAAWSAAQDWEATRAAGWPTAPGVVLELDARMAKPVGVRKTSLEYKVTARYTYTVNGREYEGDRFNPYNGWTDGATAAETRALYPPGGACDIAYDPADPARAYLAPGPQKAAWVLAGCMTGAGLLLWGMVWFIARKRRAAGRAG